VVHQKVLVQVGVIFQRIRLRLLECGYIYGLGKYNVQSNCRRLFLNCSTKDASAARAVGDVLAHRCLQAGITDIACFLSEEDRKKDKVRV
jgi:hypothetical protein